MAFLKDFFQILFGVPQEQVQRPPETQQQVDQQTQHMALYHFATCPYCRRVRSEIERLNLNIEMRDIHKNRSHHADLVQGGGKQTVPCLRIDNLKGKVRWMYESQDIRAYLRKSFG